MGKSVHTGFTLAELLIALAILGEIATFTIPKVLSSQQNSQYNAIAKEGMSTISAAYQQARLSTDASGTITATSLTQAMNYVAVDATSLLDAVPNDGSNTYDCANGVYTCVRMHNGSFLLLTSSITGNTGTISLLVDPNGYRGQKDSIIFYLLPNGRITTADDYFGSALYNPSWFSW